MYLDTQTPINLNWDNPTEPETSQSPEPLAIQAKRQ